MKIKLIIAMLILGGGLATLNTFLIAITLQSNSEKAVASAETANEAAEATTTDLETQLSAGEITQEEFDEQKPGTTEITWLLKNDWIVSTAIITIFTFGMLFLAALMLWRRDDGMPVTWGESLVYGGVLFYFLIVVNGFIPHYIVTYWDSVLVEDLTNPFVVPLTKQIAGVWNENARGWEWAWEAIRDIIVAGWYIVTLVATIALWYWAQEYPKRQASKQPETTTSPYGRPMLSTGK